MITKKTWNKLDSILSDLDQGIKFLLEEKTTVLRESTRQSDDFFSSAFYPNKKYYQIDKEIGSRLCYLYTAKATLTQLLNNNIKIKKDK